jgi:hypothetical protein
MKEAVLRYLCCVCFLAGGLYALKQGFIKTGGCLIAAAILEFIDL